MSDSRRVRIENTEYNEKYKIVFWEMLDLSSNERIRQAWRSSDLAEALGITQEISAKDMLKFCDDMIGKEINLVMQAKAGELPAMDSLSESDMAKLDKDLNNYPLSEVYQILTDAEAGE